MEKLEDITKSMRQWVNRFGPIPSHEIVAKVFEWARRIEACKNEVKPCKDAAALRHSLSTIEENINLIQNSFGYKNWKTVVLQKCKLIKSIIEIAIEMPSRNVDRAECDSFDHAAQVFARETGNEMPENPTDAYLLLWMNSLCKWLFEEYKKGDEK